MLPGHYGAVTGMSFHGAKVLITVGKDSWIHHYFVESESLAFRCLLSPPPDPPPAINVVAAPTTPAGLAMDDKGNLRLMDLRLGRKLAKVVCTEAEMGAQEAVHDQRPERIIASSAGFCVLCAPDEAPSYDESSSEPQHAE